MIEKDNEVSSKVSALVEEAFHELIEISCRNSELYETEVFYKDEIYCPKHSSTHPFRPVDRKVIWTKIKERLEVMFPDVDEHTNGINQANRLYSMAVERAAKPYVRQGPRQTPRPSSHRSGPLPGPPPAAFIVLTELEAQEFWECYRKSSYIDRKNAENALMVASLSREELASYGCPWGDHWHIGHPPTVKKSDFSPSYYRNRLPKKPGKDARALEAYKSYIRQRNQGIAQ